jgi:hypothetical protein
MFLSSIDEEIQAVKFLLASFFKYSNDEAERVKAIKEQCAKNDSVAIYTDFPKEKLQDQLISLQNQRSGK